MKLQSASLFALALVPAMLLIGCGDDDLAIVPDTTPPLAPVFEGASGSAVGVSLWWQGNSEPDLAGYNVYVVENGVASRVNDYTITTNYYTLPVEGGSVRVYVTAVDASHNESSPSSSHTVSYSDRHSGGVVDKFPPDLESGF